MRREVKRSGIFNGRKVCNGCEELAWLMLRHGCLGTVNNEHMQKKKSNKCCIFHKPKAFDESDTESDGCDSASDEEFRYGVDTRKVMT